MNYIYTIIGLSVESTKLFVTALLCKKEFGFVLIPKITFPIEIEGFHFFTGKMKMSTPVFGVCQLWA